MRQSLLLLVAGAVAGAHAAQVVTMILPMFADNQTFVGSVMSSDKDKTAYSITCDGGNARATAFCPLGKNFHVTTAPSTMIMQYTLPLDESDRASMGLASEVAQISCMSTNQAAMTCSATLNLLAGSSTVSSSSIQETITDLAPLSTAVTLTDKLPGGTAAAPSPTPTGGPGGSGSAATPGSSTTSSSLNAGPRATQNVVLAGVAALVGGAAML